MAEVVGTGVAGGWPSWCRWRAAGLPASSGRGSRQHGLGASLKGPGVIHGRLEVLWPAHLHVHTNMIWQPANKQLGSLASLNAVRVIPHLHSASEVTGGKPGAVGRQRALPLKN